MIQICMLRTLVIMSSLIFLYVDDLIITGRQLVLTKNMKSDIQKHFEMTIIGILHYFLGLHIWHIENGFFSLGLSMRQMYQLVSICVITNLLLPHFIPV